MGLFDRLTGKQNAININEVNNNPSMFASWLFPFNNKNEKPLGNLFFQSIMNQIWNGISNISFQNLSTGKTITPEAIIQFIDANCTLLVNQYIRNGYIVVFYNEKHEYRLPETNEIKLDNYGRVINKHAVVIYSPQYQSERTSLFKIAFPVIAEVNKIAGSDSYITDTLGCLGLLTGKDIPINVAGKEQLLKNIQQNMGIAADKYQFILAEHDIKYQQISPDVKNLGLQEKMETYYKYLSNLFGVPLPLLFDNASTYNNVFQARLFFYESTIQNYAEILLKVARELLTASAEFIPKSSLTYHISNVKGFDTSLSDVCKERTALLDYLLKLREAGQDVDKQIQELTNESKTLLKEI